MELGILLAASLLLLCAVVAAGIYSRTEHCFFAMREARRQVRRLADRRRRQWDY
ncbi:MAG: hypothetical protein AB7U18_24000 [Dehalococcoidia bacterium]